MNQQDEKVLQGIDESIKQDKSSLSVFSRYSRTTLFIFAGLILLIAFYFFQNSPSLSQNKFMYIIGGIVLIILFSGNKLQQETVLSEFEATVCLKHRMEQLQRDSAVPEGTITVQDRKGRMHDGSLWSYWAFGVKILDTTGSSHYYSAGIWLRGQLIKTLAYLTYEGSPWSAKMLPETRVILPDAVGAGKYLDYKIKQKMGFFRQ